MARVATRPIDFQKLFLSFSNHLHPVFAERVLRSDPALRDRIDLKDLFRRLSLVRRRSFLDCLEDLATDGGPLILTRYLYWWMIYWKQFELSPEMTARVREFAAKRFSSDSLEVAMLGVTDGSWTFERGDTDSALSRLLEVLAYLDAYPVTDEAAYRDYCSVGTRMQITRVLLRQKRFGVAEAMMKELLRACRLWGFAAELAVMQDLASLNWYKGNVAEALEMHRNPQLRERAVAYSYSRWLIHSHNCAAKCAIDLGNLPLANSELAASRELMTTGFHYLASQEGYYWLRQAELDRARGDFVGSRTHLAKAFEFFRARFSAEAPLLDAALVKAAWAAQDRDESSLREASEQILRSNNLRGDVYFLGRAKACLQQLLAGGDDEGLRLVRSTWREVRARVREGSGSVSQGA